MSYDHYSLQLSFKFITKEILFVSISKLTNTELMKKKKKANHILR